MSAVTAASGISSYLDLKERLRDDIGDIRHAEAITRTRRLVREATATAHVAPRWLVDIGDVLDRVEQREDIAQRTALLSRSLRELFVGTLLTEENYRAHCQSLISGEELAHRRQARNPLPTMDAMVLLMPDPRPLSGCERAAILAAAALRNHAATNQKTPILGTTLVPAEGCDEMIEADPDTAILVLASGLAHVVRLGPKADQIDPGCLHATFARIQREAAIDAADPASWAGIVTGLVTAAGRDTCYRIRQKLATDAENARIFAAIDRCLFAVCLDPAIGGERDVESLSRALFGNYGNRWFGMTALVVEDAGAAGVIASYNRGVEAIEGLSFADKLQKTALNIALPPGSATSNSLSGERLAFTKTELGGFASQAAAEIGQSFHGDRAFFELDIGAREFRALGMSAHSALQYLLMLAANEVFQATSLPAMSHAVSTHNGAGLKGGLDWMVVSTGIARDILDAPDDSVFLDRLRRAAADHTRKVNAARNGYSPTFFLRKPADALDRLLYEFFYDLGVHHETAYRSYLFRPTRWPNTIDILTSTLQLPDTVQFCGRPGATSDVASMFGSHIVIERHRTRFFTIPHPSTASRMTEVHAALQRWVHRLRRAASQAAPIAGVAA